MNNLTNEEKQRLLSCVNQSAVDWVKKDFPLLLDKLEKELAEKLKRKTEKGSDFSEEEYFRLIGQVYKLSYTDKKLKDLIFLYKLPDELEVITPEEKAKLKSFLIQCNTALILSIISTHINDRTGENSHIWEYISEWFSALTQAFDKYEVDFTHEKSTKNTTIKYLGKTEDGLQFDIVSNKPFWTLDITIKCILDEEKVEETVNESMTWEERDTWYYSTHTIPYWNLENNYEDYEVENLSCKVSKKVGHPSTFFTNSIFFALKNYSSQASLLTVNSNSYILKNQMTKLQDQYIEKFNKEPTLRWIAYYILTQNNEVKVLEGEERNLFLRYYQEPNLVIPEEHSYIKDIINDVDTLLYEDKNKLYILYKNQNTRRLVMMRNKSAKDKNKKNFESLEKSTTWDEDKIFYFRDFEKRLNKKVKELEAVQLFSTSIISLDQTIWWDDESSTLSELIGDYDFFNEINENINTVYNKTIILQVAKKTLTPREYFYFLLYFKGWIPLNILSELGLFQDSSVTEIKNLLKKCFAKISYWILYKTYII